MKINYIKSLFLLLFSIFFKSINSSLEYCDDYSIIQGAADGDQSHFAASKKNFCQFLNLERKFSTGFYSKCCTLTLTGRSNEIKVCKGLKNSQFLNIKSTKKEIISELTGSGYELKSIKCSGKNINVYVINFMFVMLMILV